MAYSKEELRNIFQHKFDRESWKTIVKDIFKANVRTSPEKFTTSDDAEDGYFFGVGETPDRYRIGYFFYKIKSGSVAHKKIGLRNLVKKFINPTWGQFDAAIVVFDDDKEWRLSFVCDIKEEATTPKRFTFVFGEKDNFYRTAIERFDILQKQEPTFENIRKAFSVEALSDDFFDTYRNMYADFVQYITGKRYVKEGGKWVERELSAPNYQFETTFAGDDKLVRDYIKKMFGRIVFLYFLQRKGWLDGNRQYMHDLYANSDKKDDFLDGVLEPLFFEVLNTDKPYRTSAAQALPGSENIPYLNGGLFAKDDIDDHTCVFPAEDFGKLFNFLDSYNFTIDENDSDDAEIGIDPEMLGRIFENLLEDNKDKGAFYTPKEIVDYMCRESIIAYLLNGLPERSQELIRHFVETFDASELNAEQRLYIRKKLQAVKICDPAIGSGAFPMGLVNLLSKLYVAMKSDTDTAKMKRHIMEQNIYGVDIEQGAVDIARLRFWLAMIVEEKEPIPLPNLHFKIMQGNSLLESYNGIDLSDLTKVNQQKSLFDSENSERESLIGSLRSYYNTSDHQKLDQTFNEIINNVRRQLFDKGITLPTGEDPSANTDFFLWHTWFTDVFENGGFDIVIGNPPYIQLQKAIGVKGIDKKGREYDVKLGDLYESEGFETFAKKGDIYGLFYEQGIKMLKPNGHLCFITSNKWMRAGYGESLRDFFSKKTNPILLIDFAGIQIFENATVDTNILLLAKEKNRNSTLAFAGSNKDKSILNNLSDFVRQNANITAFNTCESWVILSPIELSIKRKIEAVGTPLKDWDIQINYGIKTGFNDAFIISTEIRNQILENCADDDERKRTDELIRPILRGRDIKRYGYEWAQLWLIATFPSKNYDIEKYPSLKKYLLSFAKDILIENGFSWVAKYHLEEYCRKRLEQTGEKIYIEGKLVSFSKNESARKKTNNKWFETQDNISYWEEFSKPKITYREIGFEMDACLIPKNWVVNNKLYIITGTHLEYLISFFNSIIFNKIILASANMTGGKGVDFLEKIKIPIDLNLEMRLINAYNKVGKQYPNQEEIDKILFEYYNLGEAEIQYLLVNNI